MVSIRSSLLCVFLSLGCVLNCAGWALGQAVVCSLDSDAQPVLRVPYGAPEDEHPVKLLERLEPGDLVEHVGEGYLLLACGFPQEMTSAEQACASSAAARLRGPFRFLITSTQLTDRCSFDLKRGEMEAGGTSAVDIKSGDVRLITQRTLFGVRALIRDAEAVLVSYVYEGQVQIETASYQTHLRAGNKLVWQGGTAFQQAEITPEDVERSASLYARIDSNRVADSLLEGPQARRALYAELRSSYARVLAGPDDSFSLHQLAERQLNLGLPGEALYFARRAEEAAITSNPEEERLAAAVLLQAASYSALGRRADALQATSKALQIDRRALDNPSSPGVDRFLRTAVGCWQRSDPAGIYCILETAQRGSVTFEVSHPCKNTHTFSFRADNVRWLDLPAGADQIPVAPAKVTPVQIIFNSSGMEPGRSQGSLVIECLDCVSEPGCQQILAEIPVGLTVVRLPADN